MPSFKPAYLIHGDDHGRIGERRARLRSIAEAESAASGVEIFEGDGSSPAAVAGALATLTFALGRRFLIVDGVEGWKEAEVAGELAVVMADLPPETTVAFFAREEGRTKAPTALHDAVRAAGGEISEEATVRPWELPKWVSEQARRLGIGIEGPAAKALVAHVGERQQRLLRELEKLCLELEPGASITLATVDELAADSAERRVWTLADALLARDGAAASRLYLALVEQGERLPGLLYWVTQRLRLALEVAGRLERGESPAQLRRSLRMPPRVAERFIEDVRGTDRERLRGALIALADLELETRGGSPLEEPTATLRAIEKIAA